ncbi:uncharacterized protein LOC143890993 [Tasmannia lanceolata]|uniref:uncharacterized protein LOC143890993 n=1 Tax=Tasmannia lanceolata TaxID=3420 RepID=UPI00406314A0
MVLFSSVIEIIREDGSNSEQKGEAFLLLDLLQRFDFIFTLHLMKVVLGITNELSQALQRKDQDIVNAVRLVNISKQRLQRMREGGWSSHFEDVSTFCGKHDIIVPNLDDAYFSRCRSRRKAPQVTNLHHYRVDLYYSVIDMQLQELNNRFNETNTKLLLCIACLNLTNSFAAFDKQKLIRLAQLYPYDFSEGHVIALDNQLETFIIDMCPDTGFSTLNGVGQLAEKMVEKRKDILYPFVY